MRTITNRGPELCPLDASKLVLRGETLHCRECGYERAATKRDKDTRTR